MVYLNELCRYLKGYERIKLLISNKEGRPIENFTKKLVVYASGWVSLWSSGITSSFLTFLFSLFCFKNRILLKFSQCLPTTYSTSPILVRPFQYSKNNYRTNIYKTSKNTSFDLKSELGSFPVSSFSVVPDFVVGLEPKPLWQRSVLLAGFRQHFLDLETFVWSHFFLKKLRKRVNLVILFEELFEEV